MSTHSGAGDQERLRGTQAWLAVTGTLDAGTPVAATTPAAPAAARSGPDTAPPPLAPDPAPPAWPASLLDRAGPAPSTIRPPLREASPPASDDPAPAEVPASPAASGRDDPVLPTAASLAQGAALPAPPAFPGTGGLLPRIEPIALVAPTTPFATAGAGTGAAPSTGASPPAGAEAEVAFFSGVTAAGKVAGTAYWTWGYNRPATYNATSYSFKWGSSQTPGTAGGTVSYWFDAGSSWSTAEKNGLISGLKLWSAEANIAFSLAGSAGAANLTFVRGTEGAVTSGPSGTVAVGSSTLHGPTTTTITINTSAAGFGPIGAGFDRYGAYPYDTLVHEEGHMLGFGHGGPYNAGDGLGTVPSRQFSAFDSRLWTIMSYIQPDDASAAYFGSYTVTGTSWGSAKDPVDGSYYNLSPTTPMILDVIGIQRLYGAPTAGPLSAGGQVFGFNCNIPGTSSDASIRRYFDFTINTRPVVTLYDAGINNTLDLSGYAANATINLSDGAFSSCAGMTNNIAIAVGTVIETAYGGSGADIITGNDADNALFGLGGDDTLIGGAGADALNGGGGVNTASYATSPGGVIVNLASGTGADNDAQGDTLNDIQNLTGSSDADILTGDAGANRLSGGGGDDILKGGGGADRLDGGSGVNTASYINSAGAVTVSLASGYGSGGEAEGDVLTNIQNLTGSAQGDTLTGNSGVNVLSGQGGDDTLMGGGGADQLDGGTGNNTASYSTAGAAVVVSLASGTGSAGDADGDTLTNIQNLTGSAYNDALYGDSGDNILSGGFGNDILKGGGGSDTIDGGGDFDSAFFSFASTAATVTRTGTYAETVAASGDTTSLANVEEVVFTDLTYLYGGYTVSSGGSVSNFAVQSGGLLTVNGALALTSATPIVENGPIGGTGSVSIGAGARVTYAAAATYLGPTTISGTLSIGSGGTLANTSQIALAASGALFNIASAGAGVTTASLSMAAGSTLRLGANTLAVTGAASLAGAVTGLTGGLLTTAGNTAVAGLTVGSAAAWRNTGSVTQSSAVTIGDGSGLVARIANAAGGTYSLAGDVGIGVGSNLASNFNNNGGTLQKTAGTGTSTIAASFGNGSGAAAWIGIGSGTLNFTGAASNFVNQAISGGGTFAIGGGGLATIAGGTTITTAAWAIARNGTTVTLGQNLSYTGRFSMTNQTGLSLGGYALTLSGPASFNTGPTGAPTVGGSGKLISGGTVAVAGLTLGGSALFRDNGTVNQTGAVTLGDAGNGAATLTVAGAWNLAGDVGITAASTAAVVNIGGGALAKTAASGTRSIVAAAIVNNSGTAGTVQVSAGKLELAGTLTGAFNLKADAGTTLLLDKATSAGARFTYNGAGATLQLNDAPSFAGAIAGFGTGQNLDLRSIAASSGTTLTYADGGSGSGILTVSDGTSTASLAMAGSFSTAGFHLADDTHGGSLITYG